GVKYKVDKYKHVILFYMESNEGVEVHTFKLIDIKELEANLNTPMNWKLLKIYKNKALIWFGHAMSIETFNCIKDFLE
ncbi:hypothetical protein ACI3PL_29280, partial [Lacticaseibacillus paracasei]